MSIITNIKKAAEQSGINAVITDAEKKLEIQLNRLTREIDLPIILISWDIKATLKFNSNGWLDNPNIEIVCLLLTKPEDLTKDVAEQAAEEMAVKYKEFLQRLALLQNQYLTVDGPSIINASYQLAPRHGSAKHSGVLGRFTVLDATNNLCL